MLNLLFAYPIFLINTNVGPTTHPYYTKYEIRKSNPRPLDYLTSALPVYHRAQGRIQGTEIE